MTYKIIIYNGLLTKSDRRALTVFHVLMPMTSHFNLHEPLVRLRLHQGAMLCLRT